MVSKDRHHRKGLYLMTLCKFTSFVLFKTVKFRTQFEIRPNWKENISSKI